MKTLGIDYGEKYVGLAFSENSLAERIGEVYTQEALSRIFQLAKKLEVERFVIGLPEGRLAAAVKSFATELSKEWKGPIIFVDETLSSQNAQTALLGSGKSRKRRKTQEHAVAAAMLLQTFLDESTHV